VARDRELVSHGIRQRHAPKSSEDRAGAATARPTQRARSSRPPAATAAGLRHTAVRHPTLQPVGELYRDVDVEGGAEREEDVPDPARQLREHQPGGYMYMWWWLHVVVTRGGYTWWLHAVLHVVVTRGGYTWWLHVVVSHLREHQPGREEEDSREPVADPIPPLDRHEGARWRAAQLPPEQGQRATGGALAAVGRLQGELQLVPMR